MTAGCYVHAAYTHTHTLTQGMYTHGHTTAHAGATTFTRSLYDIRALLPLAASRGAETRRKEEGCVTRDQDKYKTKLMHHHHQGGPFSGRVSRSTKRSERVEPMVVVLFERAVGQDARVRGWKRRSTCSGRMKADASPARPPFCFAGAGHFSRT